MVSFYLKFLVVSSLFCTSFLVFQLQRERERNGGGREGGDGGGLRFDGLREEKKKYSR